MNSGQVGGFRAAEFIAARYATWSVTPESLENAAMESVRRLAGWLADAAAAKTTWQEERAEFQARMSRAAAHVRRRETLDEAIGQAWEQVAKIDRDGCRFSGPSEAAEALRNRQLATAHAVYLEAIRFAAASGVGSRGSAMVVDPSGSPIHPRLADSRLAAENASFRGQVQESRLVSPGRVEHRWVDCRPIPESDLWFETAWARFREGRIFEAS